MIKIDNLTKTISMNRGDKVTIKVTAKDDETFNVGDRIKFSIVEKNNYNNVLFQKKYIVTEESSEYFLTLLPDDTRFADIISAAKEYWYEIEYNDEFTLIGYDPAKAKKFILYPEAPDKEEE